MRNLTENWSTFWGMLVAGITAQAITILISLILLKILWAGTIHYVFPGLVEQEFIAGSISLWTAAKLTILISVIQGRFIKVSLKGTDQ